MGYKEYWEEINNLNDRLDSALSSYWSHYSNLGTWQFWVVLLLFILPLIVLYFAVDRRRIFELLFYGYTVHVMWVYSVVILEKKGALIHPYFLSPSLPMSLNITASLLPVCHLLLYQYCINTKKNFYLLTVILTAFFAFVFGTIENYIGLIRFGDGMNELWLFIINTAIVYIAYWFTKYILKLRRTTAN